MSRRITEFSDELLDRLKDDLVCRRLQRGMALLEECLPLLPALDPSQRQAGVFTGFLAMWVDIGFQRPGLVKDVLVRFPKSKRAHLSLRDYVYLRVAEGMVAMAEQATEIAIPHFDFVLSFEAELDDEVLFSIANFWKGRCLRMKGEYDAALQYTTAGRDVALMAGHQPMAAVMRVLESWLFFQKGKTKEAVRILKEAEAVLEKSDDHVTLGNIHSSYGRIAHREGRFQHAIEHFEEAIAEYKKRDPHHRNVARSLSNMAYVKRLIALQLRRKIDADVVRHRKAAARGGASRTNGSQYRTRFEQLRQEAFAALEEAGAIYKQYPNYHGIGGIHLNCGYLHMDNGDLESAEEEAGLAFTLGEQKKDYILMARSRLLQCMIGNARVEDEISGGAEPGTHARLAQDCAQDAIELVKHTQDRRLLADAYTWQGLTYSNSFFGDLDSARQSYEQAAVLSKGDHGDGTWEELQTLKNRILRKGTVDARLRAWSQGSVGDRTFQEVAEEFAEMIIPKVWEREGKKVSRVAARLSISPKKVRRILSHVGKRKPPGN
ncbi:MAG TPA: tetratricopeptide repeat protein [Terriglobales bacterium]|jgi:tetratricopeptide (TPR) repeat protein